MKLTAEEIQDNFDDFMRYIENYISEPRRGKLTKFYLKHQEEIMFMPASHKKAYHNAFPGGYVDHVNRVIKGALALNKVWLDFECEENYTTEELVFSALNHDLGKLGEEDNYAHQPSTDEWRKKNLGEMYKFNDAIAYMSVPERSIKLLVDNDIKLTQNEWLSIRLHDGLYDPANEPYLKNYMPELKPRTSLIFIIHQADLMASRIEFEKEWLPKFGKEVKKKDQFKLTDKKIPTKQKALSSVGSNNLKNLLDSI
tara:strand:+ start:1845 stop:2609 length:765 start_codon:yes stop_codon:yes gene_type:complete